ncbi:hypothetical protein SAMN05660284_02595 [Formivibrio citricus]|uniref:Uncharacterized protein n=1 Tax=Formivibrio citricus TaxID=83765 RepID=A0A1I5D7E2_9NEIS|nr:hypothetical protein [Formivibrio citricus]SFN95120.1 hypothetical protein SAMN05660284_02595 [Formivibrio citricus]
MSGVEVLYACGHKQVADSGLLARRGDLIDVASANPCTDCCRRIAEEAGAFPAVFVNVQRISDEMSAFVLELTEVYSPLDEILAQTGYARSARSLDELTPGGVVDEYADSVWRKEFWFSLSTDPLHVLALMELVKEETGWLSGYLPDAGAVHYLDFPGL